MTETFMETGMGGCGRRCHTPSGGKARRAPYGSGRPAGPDGASPRLPVPPREPPASRPHLHAEAVAGLTRSLSSAQISPPLTEGLDAFVWVASAVASRAKRVPPWHRTSL